MFYKFFHGFPGKTLQQLRKPIKHIRTPTKQQQNKNIVSAIPGNRCCKSHADQAIISTGFADTMLLSAVPLVYKGLQLILTVETSNSNRRDFQYHLYIFEHYLISFSFISLCPRMLVSARQMRLAHMGVSFFPKQLVCKGSS